MKIFQDSVLLLHDGWLPLSELWTMQASLSFLSVRIWRKFVFWVVLDPFSKPICVLLLSTPSTSGWALQLPRALHCKQPLCCHPPAPHTVGSFRYFHWLWGKNKWSPELVKQALICLLGNHNWISCRHDMLIQNPGSGSSYRYRDTWIFFAYVIL